MPAIAKFSVEEERVDPAVCPAPVPKIKDIPTDADYLTILRAVAEGAAAAGGDAALALAGSASSRFRVTALSGSFPALVDDVLMLQGDVLTLVNGEERPVLRNGSAAKRAAKGKPAPLLVSPITLCGKTLGVLISTAPARSQKELAGAFSQLEQLCALAAPAACMGQMAATEIHVTELNAVVEVGQVLTGLLDMQDVLSYVVYLAESLVRGHCASVALLSEDGTQLSVGNSTGSLRAHEGLSFPVSESLIGRVVEHGEPVITTSVSDDPRRFELEERLGPGLVVPITNVGKTIGSFMVARLEGAPPFSQESARVLQQMSAYAAIAITNADTHQQQQVIAETLRQQAADLEKAYAELSKSQDQLLISEKMAALGRVTAGIAHEINSPLGGIMNSLRAARGFTEEYGASIKDPEITQEDHEGIAGDILESIVTAESAAAKVAQFVKSIKSQTRNGQAEIKDFDPASEIDSMVVLLQHELKRRNVGLFTDMERGHRLRGDQGKFGVMIQNLVSNALDAYDGEQGEIWVRLKEHASSLQVSVEDNGCGIPEEIQGKIFDYLFTTKDVGNGTGLGLAMVHSVVKSNFKGDISLHSEVGVGTTFTITIPLATAQEDYGA